MGAAAVAAQMWREGVGGKEGGRGTATERGRSGGNLASHSQAAALLEGPPGKPRPRPQPRQWAGAAPATTARVAVKLAPPS